ncbi:MAG TPA: NDP-hexose 2,3-dehydratase family protein [archaeon]|nr:NDP-hexose 2,3-dehydratase family protein [archaeon]
MKLKDEILQLVEKSGHNVNEIVAEAAERLEEISEAENKSDIGYVLKWLEEKRKNYPVSVEEIGINQLEKWSVDPKKGNIVHDSGKFFSIIGVRVVGAEDREVPSWTQPMLKQNECGISGVICKKINGVKHYLFYAKFEPGNLHKIQISPALQVTASNLERVHLGKKPRLAEYFEEGGKGKLIKQVEGVEDGGRFYMKTNRTMIVEVEENEEVPMTDDYIWLTFPQIKKLLMVDNVMNSLARNVCAVL